MARMSIDDGFLRDPRVLRLAKSVGWSRRETMGALLDVWSICYDRVSELLSESDIDIAADRDGFSANMVQCNLARATRGMIAVQGVKQRIEYLEAKQNAGKLGGIKSGESRRKSNEAKRSITSTTPQAPSNPIPIVPDSVPDPDGVSVPDGVLKIVGGSPSAPPPEVEPAEGEVPGLSEAVSGATTQRSEPDAATGTPRASGVKLKGTTRSTRRPGIHLTETWAPQPWAIDFAKANQLDLSGESIRFADYHAARGSLFADWDAAFRTWLRNAVKFRDERGGPPAGPGRGAPSQRDVRFGRVEPGGLDSKLEAEAAGPNPLEERRRAKRAQMEAEEAARAAGGTG